MKDLPKSIQGPGFDIMSDMMHYDSDGVFEEWCFCTW